MYRRILIPASQPAEVEPLIRFASQLLDAEGEIRVLHVIPSRNLPEVTKAWRESVHIVVPAHETAAALDVPVEPEVLASPDVATAILESASTHAADAVLMTLRGNARSRNPFVGHTASSILQHAPSDVLIVNRLALATQRVGRILLPSFAADPAPKGIQVAEELALRHDGVPIVAVTLGPETAAPERGPEDGRSPRGLPLAHRFVVVPEHLLGRRHRLPELILSAAARERYGFLLLVEERRALRGPLLTRRFVETMFRDAPCPVMAVRG